MAITLKDLNSALPSLLNMMSCPTCKKWGKTITLADNDQAVACPNCKRLTWPNLGVNLPAGCAVALATSKAISLLRAVEDDKPSMFENIQEIRRRNGLAD